LPARLNPKYKGSMKTFVLAGLVFFSVPAFAASVNWNVGAVSGTLLLKGGKVTNAVASLDCRFEDGSGLVSSSPSQSLTTRFFVVSSEPADGTNDYRYRINAEAGRLGARKFFADLRSCGYVLSIVGQNVVTGQKAWGRLPLAGSVLWNMPKEELDALLKDRQLAGKISASMNPLVLEVRGDLITEAH
jgi:hypothetical protein